MSPSVDRDTKTTQIYHALNLQMTNILVSHPPTTLHCLLSHLSFQIVRPQIPTYLLCSAVKLSIGSTTGCTITEKAPTRAFSWLKVPTSAFTFKTLLRHYAKQALTPLSLNVKLGPRRKGHKGRAVWLA